MKPVTAHGPIYPRVPSMVVFFVGGVVGMLLAAAMVLA